MPHTDCEVLERILVKDFYLKIIISGQRPYFIKDFLQRFLAKQPPKIHGTHGNFLSTDYTEHTEKIMFLVACQQKNKSV